MDALLSKFFIRPECIAHVGFEVLCSWCLQFDGVNYTISQHKIVWVGYKSRREVSICIDYFQAANTVPFARVYSTCCIRVGSHDTGLWNSRVGNVYGAFFIVSEIQVSGQKRESRCLQVDIQVFLGVAFLKEPMLKGKLSVLFLELFHTA